MSFFVGGFVDFDDLLGMGALTAADKVIENKGNQIRFDNFIPQAMDKKILILINGCKFTEYGYFGKSEYDVDERYINPAYLALYDYLVKKDLITSTIEGSSLFTWDKVYKVNTQFVEENKDKLNTLLSSENTDFPELLKCYIINYGKLYDLLMNYKYSPYDEYNNSYYDKDGKKNKTTKKKMKNKLRKRRGSLAKKKSRIQL